MGIIITPQQEIEDYFESEDVNQSSVKNLTGGLDGYLAAIAKRKKDKEENKPEPDYFLIGGAVDMVLTGEEGEFDKNYYVSRLEKTPSDVEVQIIGSVFDELVSNEVIEEVDFEDCYDAILAAANEFGWQMRWKEETRVKKIIDVGVAYFEDLKRALGKKILTVELKNRIDSIVMSLTSNERTKKYFDRELQAQQDNMDFYYQLPIYFNYEGIPCKALMDLVIVHKDNNGNIIKIEPIDLKTMSGNTLQFGAKIKQHRYDIQAAWYTHALSEYFKCDFDVIEDFKFIVESTTNVGTPLVYRLSKKTLLHGKVGAPQGTFRAQNGAREFYYAQVKGFEQLMQDYIYYNEQGFIKDAILVDNPEVIEIDWFKGLDS